MKTSTLITALTLVPALHAFVAQRALLRPKTSVFAGLDDLRNMLESSWNVESMGQVPSSPDIAAREAASSILQARHDGLGNVCFVDLLLPQYDIQQGSNMYDEVEAVEFCTLLSLNLKSRSVVYVKDSTSLNTVSRLLEKREKERQQQVDDEQYVMDEVEVEIDEDDEDWEDDQETLSDSDTTKPKKNQEEQQSSEFYDDFGDLDSVGNSFFDAGLQQPSVDSSDASNEDMDSFRQQLSSGWGDSFESAPADTENTGKRKRKKLIKKQVKRKIEQPSTSQLKNYRLASLFGNNMVSEGGDMAADVVRAVKTHGMPNEEDDTMILLSANSEPEMLAIRALVSKFQDKKNIVLVNCRLDPLPLELEDCHTVYHLTPLVAAPKEDDRNIFSNSKVAEPERPPIKVVSIRRYPGDWEIYVDADGSGFELVERADASQFRKKGPSWDWIGGAIKAFLILRGILNS